MKKRDVTLPQDATLSYLEQAVREDFEVDIVLTETGYFMTAVGESAVEVARALGYETWTRNDGLPATGLRVGGLPTRLDLLEGAGHRCAVVSAREGPRRQRRVIYTTGDWRNAPGFRSAAEVLGLATVEAEEAAGSAAHATQRPVECVADEDAPPDWTGADTGESDNDPNDVADLLLDVRVELLNDLWLAFLERGDSRVLSGHRAGDALLRYAQRLARRPIRRRRAGDDDWTPGLDRIIEESYTVGRLTSEIARSVDRPTALTGERLKTLGYPDTLWPAWDDAAQAQLNGLITVSASLQQVSRTLKRSPWDIVQSLAAQN
jgi:hypothetical protein